MCDLRREILKNSIEEYLVSNDELFSLSVKKIRTVEHEADEILKKVKHDLYAYLLIPDTRSDVDRLLNGLDDFIDAAKQLLVLLSIERPLLPEAAVTNFRTISELTCLSSSHLAQAGGCLFLLSSGGDPEGSAGDSLREEYRYASGGDP